MNRLAIPLNDHPLIMIGSTPIIGDMEGLEGLRGNGQLASMLGRIGWKKDAKKGKGDVGDWQPKLAKVKRREVSELEAALKK